MDQLTNTERRSLLDLAKKVHAYKLMQAKGYDRLIKKAHDERIERLLAEIGAKKIQVIKVVRQLTELGLKESKDLVDGAPSTVLEAVAKEAAEDAKNKLEAEGATVEIK